MLFKPVVFKDDSARGCMGKSTSVDVQIANQVYRQQIFLDAITLSFKKFSKMLLLLYTSFTWHACLSPPRLPVPPTWTPKFCAMLFLLFFNSMFCFAAKNTKFLAEQEHPWKMFLSSHASFCTLDSCWHMYLVQNTCQSDAMDPFPLRKLKECFRICHLRHIMPLYYFSSWQRHPLYSIQISHGSQPRNKHHNFQHFWYGGEHDPTSTLLRALNTWVCQLPALKVQACLQAPQVSLLAAEDFFGIGYLCRVLTKITI